MKTENKNITYNDYLKLWKNLDNHSKAFWRSGGRGSQEGFIKYEMSKKY